ncbi:hypothetical protein EIP86_001910 [Pleurotus ostreatoroseus]|nr:hypothetical protein EIP86_001910 [Pleurotus ostreatoroseus]
MSQQYVPGISASSRSGFEGVAHEAEEYSVSTSESSSNGSYYGIGYLSGRWIQYIGEVALRGAERMGTAVKLRNIEHELKHEPPSRWKPQTMETLLEFQRVFFVYADGVRRKAWDLIFFAMEKKGWEPLVVTIESWPPKYNMEKRWFIQQLTICKLSGWSVSSLKLDIF